MADAKDAIKAQFMRKYAKRAFSEITVKSLCAAALVARTTFYAYFSNTDDVLREIEDELLEELEAVTFSVSGGDLPGMDFERFMDAVEDCIKEHWSEIHAFLVSQPNLRFMRKWKDAIKEHFRQRYPEKKMSRSYEAVAEIMASSMVSAYAYWMEHPDTASTADIKRLIRRMLDTLVSHL
ncbi:MAG: TetR family transcriptional regulator [Clostridia bacterium]|nr:TetR family transcriptional regulator [Clostridia bacterium]